MRAGGEDDLGHDHLDEPGQEVLDALQHHAADQSVVDHETDHLKIIYIKSKIHTFYL